MIGEKLNLTNTTVHQIITNELRNEKKLAKNGSKKNSHRNKKASRGKRALTSCNRLKLIPSFYNVLLVIFVARQTTCDAMVAKIESNYADIDGHLFSKMRKSEKYG